MINLGSWMNGILIGWGVDPKIANTFDEMSKDNEIQAKNC